MNVERLEILKDTLRYMKRGPVEGLENAGFNMNYFSYDVESGVSVEGDPAETHVNYECDTVYCIGGLTNLLFDGNIEDENPAPLLGLSDDLGNLLFYPDDRNSISNCIIYDTIDIDQAIEAIDNVIKHEDPLWEEVLTDKNFS